MTPASAIAVFCLLVALGHSDAMQFSVLQPLPMDDEEPNSVAQLPQDATRSEWDDENVHGKVRPGAPWPGWRAQVTASHVTPSSPPPFFQPSPALPRGPEPGLDDVERKDTGTAGAGFGAACGESERCSSSLGLACLKSEHEEYRCGCGKETPVPINEGGVMKCVRAKAMYESCVSHQECSFQNPNLQCVDFLCYCPLPYVLTEMNRCLEPSSPHNNMMYAIAPTAVLIAVLLLIGGAYTYRKVSGGSGALSSGSSVVGLRSASDRRRAESTRRVSSAIRLGRKAEASRRLRLSLDEHGAALRAAKAPRHPPRFIKSKPRQQSIQRTQKSSCSPDVLRSKVIEEETTLSSESTGEPSHHGSPRRTGKATSKTTVVHRILPVHEEVAVHIIHKSPTSASQELSTEVPWLKQAQKEAAMHQSPTRLLLPRDDPLNKMLNEAEVKVSVERQTSTASDDTRKAARPPPRFTGEHRNSGSQRSGRPLGMLREATKVESTTEDSFMREIRFQMRASSVPTISVQERAMSTEVVRTTDTAVQLDNVGPEMVDKSQQMSDQQSLGTEVKVVAPVHKLVKEAKAEHVPANRSEQKVKVVEEDSSGSRQVSVKDMKGNKPEELDTSSSKDAQRRKPNKIPAKRLSFLNRIFSDSSTSKIHVSVSKELLPVPEPAQIIPESLPKAGNISHVLDTAKPKGGSKKDTGTVKSKVPVLPKAGAAGSVPKEPTRIPAFKDVLQELVKHYAEKKASKASAKDVTRIEVAERTPSLFTGTGLTAPETTTLLSSTSKTDVAPKGVVRQSPFVLRERETIKSVSPPMSPRFYTTTMEDSDTLCPKVRGIIHARESQRVASRTRIGELRRRVGFVDQTASGSHNFATTTIAEETEGRDVKSFLHPHTVKQDGKKGEQCTATNIAAIPQSSGQDITTVGNKPFKICAWGDSFSVTDETLSTEGRVDGYVPPNSPPVQVLSLRQELEAADAAAGVSLEQTFRAPLMDANWSLATPEAVLGSMDVESSETSTGGGLRATFKQSVDLESRMIVPYEEDALMIPAQKSKKAKGSERKKRVNFQEKPFTDVLAEIEEDDEEFAKEAVFKQGDLNMRASNDSVAEASVGRSASNEDDEGSNRAFFKSRAVVAKEREIEQKGDVELGKEAVEVQACLPLVQEAAGQNNALLAVQEYSTQLSEMVQNRHVVEMTASTRQLSVTPSTAVSSRNTLLSHPFCPSDEGPLLPSASTTLSFMSSDSSVSFGHRVTDLTCLHALADLAVPFQETGDGKSQTGVANLPTTMKPEPSVPEELHRFHLEPQLRSPQQYQVGKQPPKQQRQEKLRPTPSQSPSVEDRSARSSRRCRMLEQAKRQDSVEKRSARLPKRPNTGERQRLSRFATKERRWGDDILQVIMMGNKHYLRERSLSSPRPRSASIPGAALLLDETQYITQQIEQAHAAIHDPDHTCPSPELRQAAESAQAVVASEEVATTSVRSRESSDSAVKGAILPWSNRRASSPASLSGRVSQRPSQRTCSRPPSSLASADALGARHATWGPGGEQRKMDTIAEAVCAVELKDPKAVTGAMAPKISDLKTAGDVFSGDTLAKDAVQVIVVDDNEDVPATLPSELGTESQLTPSSPQWDVCERDLIESIKMLSAAVGTPESFAKTIELPSPEGLQLSETSTMASRVDTVGPSSIGCSVALDPSASALSHTRTGSSKNTRSRRLSTKILEGACFESMYNSILQPDSSPALSLSIPGLGSRDFLGFLGPRDRPSGPTSEQSALPRCTDDSKTGSVSADTATTSGPASFASALAKQECSGSHEVQVQRRAETSALRSLEPTNSMPPPSSRPRPRSGSRRRASRTPSSGTLRQPSSSVVLPEDSVAEGMVADSERGAVAAEVDSEEDRSSFFSFEESASETSLLPDAANLDWWASSQASRSRTDLA